VSGSRQREGRAAVGVVGLVAQVVIVMLRR
jgi:hypothetical protein